MTKIVHIGCLLLIAGLRLGAQSMQVAGSRVQLPPGEILGAAFYEDKEMFFVQQIARSTENDGVVTRARRLSSWNIESRLMITKRIIEDIPVHVDPCGRVQISTAFHQLYLCGAGSHLDIMDPDSLETIGTMAQSEGQTIIDFAVDDLRGRVLVLSARKDHRVHLTSYSLTKGEALQDTILPVSDLWTSIGNSIAVSRSGKIALVLDDQVTFVSNNKRGIYLCLDAPDLVCTKTLSYSGNLPSGVSFLDETVLFANNDAADGSRTCIYSSASSSLKWLFGRGYCARNGVHYSVGVVDDKYVVGFTGLARYHPWSENWSTISSSFSVWKAGNFKAAAIVNDLANCAVPSCEIRIAASNTKPLFLTYQRTSNALYLYSITDH